MKKMNIKGVFQIWMNNGDYHEVPLKECHAWTREGCKMCPDFAAEHADISTGGIGKFNDWTLTIVRTDVGRELMDGCSRDGVDRDPPRRRRPRRDRADAQALGEVAQALARVRDRRAPPPADARRDQLDAELGRRFAGRAAPAHHRRAAARTRSRAVGIVPPPAPVNASARVCECPDATLGSGAGNRGERDRHRRPLGAVVVAVGREQHARTRGAAVDAGPRCSRPRCACVTVRVNVPSASARNSVKSPSSPESHVPPPGSSAGLALRQPEGRVRACTRNRGPRPAARR